MSYFCTFVLLDKIESCWKFLGWNPFRTSSSCVLLIGTFQIIFSFEEIHFFIYYFVSIPVKFLRAKYICKKAEFTGLKGLKMYQKLNECKWRLGKIPANKFVLSIRRIGIDQSPTKYFIYVLNDVACHATKNTQHNDCVCELLMHLIWTHSVLSLPPFSLLGRN